MGKAWQDFGMQVAQDTVGSAMGLMLGKINDARQLNQQRKLQAIQMQGQKELTSYNQASALQMWKDTNYGPQMEELRKAGLNPGLIYGMSGGGGQTAQVTQGNLTGGHAPVGGGEAIAMGQTMSQLGLMRAQKENIEAHTELLNSQKPKTEAETTNLLQGVENLKAQQELTEVQTRIEYVREHIATMTQNHAVAMIQTELKKNLESLAILENDRTISDNTIKQKEGIIRMTYALMILDKYKKVAETININQQTKESIQRVSLMIQENMRNWDKMSQTNTQLDINKGMWDDLPNPLKEVLDQILIIPGLGKGTNTPIRGFHKR